MTTAEAWERWRGEIAKACDGSHHTIESIEAGIAAGHSTVLFAPDCCLVVEVQDYPSAKACQVSWAAGDIAALIEAAPLVHDWAKARGCTEMLIEGHPGWKRALAALGYRQWSVTLRRAL